MVNSSKRPYKEKFARRQEEKAAEPEQPKYRDRAKERREDQNPDYEPTELGAFHAVAPPGTFDLRAADAHKLSIEKSKYLGGDVEHTHLVKGLDYALLNKVRSEIGKKKEEVAEKVEEKPSVISDDQPVSFRSAFAKSVYQAIFKPQSTMKTNEMFLPGRMAFIYTLEGGYANEIPTTLHRSKADCPIPEEMVAITVDRAVLDEMGKIMQCHRLGTSGKTLKKKKKDKDTKGISVNDLLIKKTPHVEDEPNSPIIEEPDKIDPEPLPSENIEQTLPRDVENDIFVGDGIDYEVIGKDTSQSPKSEDMEESPRNKEKPDFTEPIFGPTYDWHEMGTYDAMQQQQYPTAPYAADWQEYQYPEQYIQQPFDGQNVQQDPRFMTQEEKNRGLGSVFKRDDERLQQLREKDAREKDPNFISDSYSECYPGYQEYNREIVDSDDEVDISKMDMGSRAKGRLHRWDFETEEEWANYNEQKEAMPKAAFQFGVKMQDGRKTRKQNRDQKLNNELHQINKILARKKAEKESAGEGAHFEDDTPAKKPRN